LFPPRPSLGCPGTIGSSVPGSPHRFFRKQQGLSSHALRRHLKRLAPTLATALSVPCRPWSEKNRTSHKLSGPTAFPESRALLFTPTVAEAAQERCPVPTKSHPRVWLPSRCDGLAPKSLGISFNPQRSWASLFRALLLPGDRETLSSLSFRSCAFRQNLHDLVPALQRLAPTQKAASLRATRVISSGRDLLLS
jgi:hypothetical protein